VKFLLDTNIISEIRKRDRAHAGVARWVAQTPPTEIGTSVIVLAEIRRGIELKRRTDPQQAALLDRWFRLMRGRLGDRVLPIDESIAEAWARLNVPDPLPLVDGLRVTLPTSLELACHSSIRSPHEGLSFNENSPAESNFAFA
jgi:toxin FitB